MLREKELLSNPAIREAANVRKNVRVPYPFVMQLMREVKAGRWDELKLAKYEDTNLWGGWGATTD